jgi:hypothetical protein
VLTDGSTAALRIANVSPTEGWRHAPGYRFNRR